MSDDPEFDASKAYNGLFVAATGSLIMRFARIEIGLSFELRRHLQSYMGAKNDMQGFYLASAIYGGMRFKNSSKMVKRLAEQLGYSADAVSYIENFFAHLGHIADLRDRLAHQLVMPAGDDWDGNVHIVDAFNTHYPANYKRYELHVEALVDAGRDLVLAERRISAGLLRTKGSRKRFDLTPVAWRYRPSALRLVRQKKASSPQGSKRPPQSSRASE